MAWSFFARAMASPGNASLNARRLWKCAFHGGALDRVRVVLVSPQQAGNVGSVCRVATNFGEFDEIFGCSQYLHVLCENFKK